MLYHLTKPFISPKFPRFMTVGDGPWQRARPRLNVWRQTLPSVGTLTGRATFLDPETLRPLSEGADKRREGLLIGDCPLLPTTTISHSARGSYTPPPHQWHLWNYCLLRILCILYLMDGWMDGLPIPRLVVAQCWGCLVSVDAPLHLVGWLEWL